MSDTTHPPASADPSSIPTVRNVFDLAWPLTLKAMMLHGVVVIDAYLVSSLGEAALAAMGLAGAIGGLLLGILFAFSNATQIRVAQAFGATGQVGLKTGFYCGLAINLVSTLLGMAMVFAFGDWIIDGFAQTEWIGEQAKAYLSVFVLVVLGEAVGQSLGSHFNGQGQTKWPFYSYLVTLPVNVVISLMLIHGLWGAPALGVVGAAYGSVAAALARVAFLGAIFLRQTGAFREVAGWARGSFAYSLWRHLKFSLPIAGTFVSSTFGAQACMLIYAKMSVNDFAAMTLVMPWINTAGTAGMMWAQASGILIAQMLGGQRNPADLDAFLSRVWRASFVAAALVSLAYLVFGLTSGIMYAGLQDETRAALLMFLPILLILPFPKQSNAMCGHTLRASGDTLRVMNIFIIGQWLFKVPLTILFVITLQLPVIWVFALVLMEELFKLPMFHLRLFKGDWKNGVYMDD
jgi:Na+-driven multidrug efflux pump